ncbi:MAG: hypothetical protein COT71_00525 [Candidatus Andersenbacteria bacterium CG10_big_fil_rev_8_21_14_0_10_54_11]|uniref:Uncharacterized protein n=1 Tax=Candidatus Andersenbacteria bacterium CG10_big_fil_rev_8_21_14_0_10_54_11 TaxID=1974485 RepID=A0A2M6X0B8_9BACT|nr:MAG: hypothetical protein COT71_00525 [Candidatus Andersenbacteria bacterium CG10_big_fil_rev_8_21_14_0_10_54_11]
MEIYIDDGTGDDWFFISVPISNVFAVSFDYTLKGHRILQQLLIAKKPFPTDQKPTMEWDTIVLENGQLLRREHVRWLDKGQDDWVNDEIWQTIWQEPLTDELKNKLLAYSNLVRKNANNVAVISGEVADFERLLRSLVAPYAYPKQNWINPSVEVREDNIGGKGMFAIAPIKKGEMVVVWGGEALATDEAKAAKQKGKLVMQWDEDLWTAEDRGDDISY